MFLFGRQELLCTQNLGQLSTARQALQKSGIRAVLRVANRQSPSPFDVGTRARCGSFGQKADCIYTLYVKKGDYEEAAFILRGIKP